MDLLREERTLRLNFWSGEANPGKLDGLTRTEESHGQPAEWDVERRSGEGGIKALMAPPPGGLTFESLSKAIH